jgi:alkanesulfonate monooxygenase SsuD/methylene tetrahydromethanopterin reductase-like flavin-dependent oxidoreductase (luciferase family)
LGNDAILSALRARSTVVGTPETVRAQLGAYAAAGVEEIMLRWTALDDLERLRAFAAAVLPGPAGEGGSAWRRP